MNRESRYNAIMAEASRIYREDTGDAFDQYVRDIEKAGKCYKASTGDVLAAQDVFRGVIEDAGEVYDWSVNAALELYIAVRDAAGQSYRNTEKCP